MKKLFELNVHLPNVLNTSLTGIHFTLRMMELIVGRDFWHLDYKFQFVLSTTNNFSSVVLHVVNFEIHFNHLAIGFFPSPLFLANGNTLSFFFTTIGRLSSIVLTSESNLHDCFLSVFVANSGFLRDIAR